MLDGMEVNTATIALKERRVVTSKTSGWVFLRYEPEKPRWEKIKTSCFYPAILSVNY